MKEIKDSLRIKDAHDQWVDTIYKTIKYIK